MKLYVKIITVIASVILLSVAALGIITLVNQGNADNRITAQDNQIKEFKDAFIEIQTALENNNKSIIEAIQDINTNHSELINSNSVNIANLQIQINELLVKISALEAENVALKEQIKALQP